MALVHYNDVIMGAIASQITSITTVYSTVYSGADQRKHESSASLAFVREIHRGPVNSPHKWPVTRKVFPFDDVIMYQLDKPYGFPDDHQQMQLCFNVMWILVFTKCFSVPVSLLYSVGNKTYNYYWWTTTNNTCKINVVAWKRFLNYLPVARGTTGH